MVDIIARLQMNAEQFSSETGKRFAEVKQRAASAAEDVRKPFAAAFADVQRQAAQALVLPRTKAGALDLSQEISSLRESAAAADQRATALRELANAQLAVANSGRADAEALRVEADASMVAARAAEAAATADRQRIGAIEEVQRQLNKTTSATTSYAAATNRATVSAGQKRAAMQQLGFQINDVATMYAGGAKPLQIFATQTGQVVQALGMMTNSTTGLLGFLAGPWSAVLTAATLVAVPFVAKLWEGNTALKDQIDKLKQNAAEAALAEQAKREFGRTEAGVFENVRKLTDELNKQNDALKTNAERQNIAAKDQLGDLRLRRSNIVVERSDEQMKVAAARAAFNATPEGDIPARLAAVREVQKAEARVAAVEQRLRGMDIEISTAQANLLRTRADLAAEAAKVAADPIASINRKYDSDDGLIAQAKKRAIAEGTVTTELTRQLTALEKQRTKEIEAARERARDARGAAKANREFGRDISSDQAAAIVRGIGGQVNSVNRTYAQQKSLYDAWIKAGAPSDNPVAKPGTSAHERGNALDVQFSADLSIKKLREAFEREGVRLTKAFAERGHWHLEWAKSSEAVREATQAAKDAERVQRELDQALASVEDKFAPAAAAARRYRVELEQINKLLAGGRISTGQYLDYALESGRQYRAAKDKDYAADFRRIIGPDEMDETLGRLNEGIKNTTGFFQQELDARRQYTDALRNSIGDIANLFGIRISGPLGALLQPGGAQATTAPIGKEVALALRSFGVISEKSVEKVGDKVSGVLQGAMYGQAGGSVFASITGGKESPTASAIGGALGKIGGEALGKAVGGLLGKVGGPLGSIVGGVLGNLVGGLFRSIKWGSASVDLVNGKAVGGNATGKGADEMRSATGSASGLAKGINQVVDALGAQISSLPGITIGNWDGKARVALTKTNAALHYNNFNDSVLKDFGKDGQQAALEYAIAYSVSHAVLTGISQASKNIIAKGSDDIEGAIQKALLIEAIPRDLKAMVDPVGAAIDELNRKWAKTKAALDEGGASTEQMAQAQRLYQMQLDQIKASTASASATLKDFLTTLNIGSSSPLSLRDQESAALAQLKPFLTSIEAGQTIDQGKYQAAAQSYLDIERQLYGSTSKFFEAFDAVQAATNKAIASIDNAAPVSDPVASPFAKATADSTAATAKATQATAEIGADTNALLQQIAALMQQVAANTGGSAGSAFIGLGRNFVAAA